MWYNDRHGPEAQAGQVDAAAGGTGRRVSEAPARTSQSRQSAEDPFGTDPAAQAPVDYWWPSFEDVQQISEAAVDNHQGYRDPGGLEGSIGNTRIAQHYGQHEDLFHTAADLMMKIQRQQAIVEGNKRTAAATGLVFLEQNGVDTTELSNPQVFDELVQTLYATFTQQEPVEALARFLRQTLDHTGETPHPEEEVPGDRDWIPFVDPDDHIERQSRVAGFESTDRDGNKYGRISYLVHPIYGTLIGKPGEHHDDVWNREIPEHPLYDENGYEVGDAGSGHPYWEAMQGNVNYILSPEGEITEMGDVGYYDPANEDTYPLDETSFKEVQQNILNHKRTARLGSSEWSGYSNWDTMEVGFALEGNFGYELYDAFRKFMSGNPPEREEFEQWVIENIIGPYNAEREQEAHTWNAIPEHDRLDHSWEDLKDKSPDAADLVSNLMGGWGGNPNDVSDVDLNDTQINPWNVNFNELYEDALREWGHTAHVRIADSTVLAPPMPDINYVLDYNPEDQRKDNAEQDWFSCYHASTDKRGFPGASKDFIHNVSWEQAQAYLLPGAGPGPNQWGAAVYRGNESALFDRIRNATPNQPFYGAEPFKSGEGVLEAVIDTMDQFRSAHTSHIAGAPGVDSWTTPSNTHTQVADPTGIAPGLNPTDLQKKLRMPCFCDVGLEQPHEWSRICEKQRPAMEYEAALGSNWVYLEGQVGFGQHWWQIAQELVMEMGLDEDTKSYITNLVARNSLPPGIDMAVGSLKNSKPQVWSSSVDRNAVYDAVKQAWEQQDK